MWSDLRHAVRTLSSTPVFTTVAVLCVALGIGANTAIFSGVDAVLLRTLPVPNPEELVVVQSLGPRGGSTFSHPQFAYLRRHADAVDGILAYARIDLNLSASHLTDAPSGLLVSDTYFSTLGVQPAIGRMFAAPDEPAVVLNDRYWKTRFNGDPTVVGRAVILNGVPVTIVGVTPPRFFGLEVGRSPDVFVPLLLCDRLTPGGGRLARANNFWLTAMARLRPEVPVAEALDRLNAVYQQSVSEPSTGVPPNLVRFLRERRIVFAPGARGAQGLGAQYGRPLLILMTVVGLVLLIACANVANLLLLRSDARRRDTAVRFALGAGRARLIRQLLTESLLLAAGGGALGLAFGVWSTRVLTSFLANRVIDVSLDARLLGFTALATLATAVLFGVAPALRATRGDLTPAFRSVPSAGALGGRLGGSQVLVCGQVAVSIVLLVGAGVFIRTLGNLRAIDAGFRGEDVLLATMNPGLSRYTPERTRAFYAELVEQVSALPAVAAASFAEAPFLVGTYVDGFSIEGGAQSVEASLRLVTPRFFDTMGIPVRSGRDFSRDDRSDSPKVVIINETIAQRYFAGQNPIGKRITGGGGSAVREIVGVVADTKYRTLREAAPNMLFLPIAQAEIGSERTLHLRTAGEPSALAPAIRDHVRRIDDSLPVKIATFADVVDENLAQERLVATLSAFFGGLALLLTATGLYGVIAFSVQRRTREIGIRMALGASRTAVRWMVVRDCVVMVGLGAGAGVAASFWLGQFVAPQLYGLESGDAGTRVAATGLLIAVALLAGYLPARRASRIAPTTALRYE